MKFHQCHSALIDSIKLQVEIAAGDSREHSFILSERIRLASVAMTDEDRQALIGGLHREAWGSRRELLPDEAVAFASQSIYIVEDPNAKKPRRQFRSKIQRGVHHKLVRLPLGRIKAKQTRRKLGDESRRIVCGLIHEAINSGTPRRNVRSKVRQLAAIKRVIIPAEWQLDYIINEFFKVDTTT